MMTFSALFGRSAFCGVYGMVCSLFNRCKELLGVRRLKESKNIDCLYKYSFVTVEDVYVVIYIF